MQATTHQIGRTFWFVSAPSKHIQVQEIKEQTKGSADSVEVFPIPKQLRIGTPDDIYALNDDLLKVDTFVENTVKKIIKQMLDLAEEDAQKEKDKKSSAPDFSKLFTVANVNMETYMRRFEWHHAKFKVANVPLKEIVDAISVETTQLDEELRTMQSEYLTVGHSIDAFERNKGGNLQVRDLSFIIESQHVTESKHLTTVFVVVPKSSIKEFEQSYETLVDNVVPRSSQEVFKDEESVLRTVVLFKQAVDEFKQKILKKKWNVRDFKFDKNAVTQKQDEIDKQREKRKELRSDLIRWCRTNFSEAFSNWVHLKALKVFAESILRYGLPRDFICLVVEPKNKSQGKLRSFLDSHFKSLGSSHIQGDVGDVVIVGTTTEKFFSYVFTDIML